jgi:hypothetical protein
LHQKWLALFPEDISAQADFAETHFTTGRFAEFSRRIKPLLDEPEISAGAKIALRMIDMARLLASGHENEVPAALDSLIQAIAAEKADFQITWSFHGTLNYVNQHEKLVSYRAWLNQFFGAAQSENREAIIEALREAKAQFSRTGGSKRK